MKKLLFSILAFTVIAIVTGFSIRNNAATGQTEEYALMQLTESVLYKNIKIDITIGEDQTTYDTVTREKNERFNWAPIIKKMNELNAQGFELLGSSTGATEVNGYRYIYHSYTFVRKVK